MGDGFRWMHWQLGSFAGACLHVSNPTTTLQPPYDHPPPWHKPLPSKHYRWRQPATTPLIWGGIRALLPHDRSLDFCQHFPPVTHFHYTMPLMSLHSPNIDLWKRNIRNTFMTPSHGVDTTTQLHPLAGVNVSQSQAQAQASLHASLLASLLLPPGSMPVTLHRR